MITCLFHPGNLLRVSGKKLNAKEITHTCPDFKLLSPEVVKSSYLKQSYEAGHALENHIQVTD